MNGVEDDDCVAYIVRHSWLNLYRSTDRGAFYAFNTRHIAYNRPFGEVAYWSKYIAPAHRLKRAIPQTLKTYLFKQALIVNIHRLCYALLFLQLL